MAPALCVGMQTVEQVAIDVVDSSQWSDGLGIGPLTQLSQQMAVTPNPSRTIDSNPDTSKTAGLAPLPREVVRPRHVVRVTH